MKTTILLATTALATAFASAATYPIVDTGQTQCYDTSDAIPFPAPGARLHGQDAQYTAHPPSYTDNGDGTVTDRVTGLMWTQDPGEKKTFPQAVKDAAACHVGGHADWRLPTIKELYSLIQFNGTDPDPTSTNTSTLTPFIDASVFNFRYGDTAQGERIIDAQFASATKYVSTTMDGSETVFGVNFADGRIKGYGLEDPRGREKTFFVLYVRGRDDYGKNRFTDNRDGTVTDEATGLTWMKADSGTAMDWPSALEYAGNLQLAGHSDWRLPNAKELQSIVDYSRSPDTTGSAAIDPIFDATGITNEGGRNDFANYWSSTSHLSARGAEAAIYIAFGRSLGFMKNRRTGETVLMDVHGAGSQRSDPKVGDASHFPTGRGPQGDVIRIQNMVRCVRGGNVESVTGSPGVDRRQPRTTPQRGARPMGNEGRAGGPRRGPGGAGFIKRLDRNGDDRISPDEFDGPPEHFPHLDQNSDGYITENEAPNGPPPGGRR